MPERNLERKKGLRPRASARPRDYSETASEISEEFASASEIREKSWLEFGRNSRGIREEFRQSPVRFWRPPRLPSAEVQRTSAELRQVLLLCGAVLII